MTEDYWAQEVKKELEVWLAVNLFEIKFTVSSIAIFFFGNTEKINEQKLFNC